MIIDFLNHLRSDYLSNKSELETELKKLEMKINENEKIVKKYEEEGEKNFNAFSPRKQNTNIKDKIDNLNTEKDTFLEAANEIKEKISQLDAKVSEIDIVLEDTKKKINEMEHMKESYHESKNSVALRNLSIQNLTSMLHKLDFCSKLIQMDPVRCKIELSSVSKLIRDTIDEIYKVI